MTESGLVKRTLGEEFISNVRTVASTKLKDQDRVIFAAPCGDMEFAVLKSSDGFFLRFALTEVPLMKKNAAGVKGITLAEDDRTDAAWLLEHAREFSTEYAGRTVSLNRLKLAKRGGKGTKSRKN